MFKTTFITCLFLLALKKGAAHTYRWGKCHSVEPMPQFSMDRMLGLWYVIQKTSTASFCITYNLTKLDEPGRYQLEQTSQHFLLGLTPLKHQYHYTGELKVPDPAVPGQMRVKFPLNIGSASFTVFLTDYENYAGIFTCQSFGIGHRRSASILSRTKSLDKLYLEKVRTRLASYNVDPFDLSIISQNDCPKPKPNETYGFDININPNTFSKETLTGVVQTAGKKIGEGFEYVTGGAKPSSAAVNTGKIRDDVEVFNVASGTYKPETRAALKKADDETVIQNWLP